MPMSGSRQIPSGERQAKQAPDKWQSGIATMELILVLPFLLLLFVGILEVSRQMLAVQVLESTANTYAKGVASANPKNFFNTSASLSSYFLSCPNPPTLQCMLNIQIQLATWQGLPIIYRFGN